MPGESFPCLNVISGKMVGHRFPLNRPSSIIGRGPDIEIPVTDQQFSRRHAELTIQHNRVVIKDLKSRTSVYVNDLKVVGSSLSDGDIIQIGTTIFKLIMYGKDGSLPPRTG